jgi:Uma2 family endonuclease
MSMPSSVLTEIDYPESDGKPMGETDLHRRWMIRIIDLLQHRYRDERVYVSGDLLIYYEEGNVRKFIVPDAFVVLDCEPGDRRVYKTWEEGKVPNVIFETTSRSTRRTDEKSKPSIFKKLGIPEYFLYDPTSDYLVPPLQGFRLVRGKYQPIGSDADGRLYCEQLGLHLLLEDGDLVIVDAKTGELLLTEAEAAAEAIKSAEAEIERLRDKLRQHGLLDDGLKDGP